MQRDLNSCSIGNSYKFGSPWVRRRSTGLWSSCDVCEMDTAEFNASVCTYFFCAPELLLY